MDVVAAAGTRYMMCVSVKSIAAKTRTSLCRQVEYGK